MIISARAETSTKGRMRTVLVAVTLAGLTLAGCSSSSGHREPASAARSAASGLAADRATTTAIAAAYSTFFSSSSSVDQAQAVLQHGTSFRAALIKEGQGSDADRSGATVTAARLVGPDVADVTFDVTSNGKTQLSGFPGKAVRENGTWKVAAATFCALTGLQGSAPGNCKNASLTALPR